MREGTRTVGVCMLLAVATVVAVLAPVATDVAGRRSIPEPWGLLAVLALAMVSLLMHARSHRRGGPGD